MTYLGSDTDYLAHVSRNSCTLHCSQNEVAPVSSLLRALSAQVDHLTELLQQTTQQLLSNQATTQRLLSALANTSAEPSTQAAAVGMGSNTPAEPAASGTSHPAGWFRGKLPGFGTCGGRGGSLTEIWEVWGGAGPGKVTRGEAGLNLRAHGETTVKEQEVWGSSSNYGRYLQAGTYMDDKIASIKVQRPKCSREMLVAFVESCLACYFFDTDPRPRCVCVLLGTFAIIGGKGLL